VEIILEIDEPFAGQLNPASLEKTLLTAFNLCPPPPAVAQTGTVTVVITDNDTVQQLNQQYRGINAPTDVLSFENTPDPDFPAGDTHLGDIIIAYPVAEAQAQTAGHAASSEVTLLAVHGALHLLGFDHDTPAHKNKMWATQLQIMTALGLAHIQPTES
jgi:probable rRNA maturation factor